MPDHGPATCSGSLPSGIVEQHGKTYKSALAMTLLEGSFAFILSFVAIRSLATSLGVTEQVFGVPVASIFPMAIEVSIGHATLCLLSLSTPAAAAAAVLIEAGSPAERAADGWRCGGEPAGTGGSGCARVSAKRLDGASEPSAQGPGAAGARRTPLVSGCADGHPGRALAAVKPASPAGGIARTNRDSDDDLLVIEGAGGGQDQRKGTRKPSSSCSGRRCVRGRPAPRSTGASPRALPGRCCRPAREPRWPDPRSGRCT